MAMADEEIRMSRATSEDRVCVNEIASGEIDYSIHGVADVMTPALAIYEDLVERNILATLRLLDGDPGRWRPHVKTTKMQRVIKMLVARGISTFKCATTLELVSACRSGASDVLVAFPTIGPNAMRLAEIARTFPNVKVSVLIDSVAHISQWVGSKLGIFIDINPGMNRTGISQDGLPIVAELVASVLKNGLAFRGLHYYDGHVRAESLPTRTAQAHDGYDRLLRIVEALQKQGLTIGEVITAGTPAFPCALSYAGFKNSSFAHRVSPGTVVYGDLTSQSQLPPRLGYHIAASVVSRIVSRPLPGIVTCDAGHKSISTDAGIPNCAVWGHANLSPTQPSEEHLPISGADQSPILDVGRVLYLLPKHVCPTVNNFSHALVVRNNQIVASESVDARGHEAFTMGSGR
jgi:D-serine deaminase-like pyridoxal phosphate-dependent protein